MPAQVPTICKTVANNPRNLEESAVSRQFYVGDLVCRADRGDDLATNEIGEVTGFCPGPRWVRVKTGDGRHRIWLKDNVHNVDSDLKEGNHAS